MSSGKGGTKRSRKAGSGSRPASQARLGDDLHPKPHSDSSRASSVARSHAGATLDEFFDFGGDNDSSAGLGFSPLEAGGGDGDNPELSFDLGGGNSESHGDAEEPLFSDDFWRNNSYTSIGQNATSDTSIGMTATSTSASGLRESADTAFLGYTAQEEEDTLTAIRLDADPRREGAPTDHPVAIRPLEEYVKPITDSSQRAVFKQIVKSHLLFYTEQELTCTFNHKLVEETGCVPRKFRSQCYDREAKERSKFFLEYLRDHMDTDRRTMQFSQDIANNTDDATLPKEAVMRIIQSTRETLYPHFKTHLAFHAATRIAISQSDLDVSREEQEDIDAAIRASLQDSRNEAAGEGSSTGIPRR
ncbi:uncharacterized protein L199_007401 [Kwoniella botswanensis]|uniref:uncharacterized protein n=1 Tax=Kwoniella botswanensis TaxID=1268659 RepID=UPI00315DA084